MFSATPPDAEFADVTPATTPARLAPIFAAGFGTDNLITNSYRLSFLRDAQANPDGGWPTTTTGAPAASPGLRLRQVLKQNDLRNWTPTAPMLLCGGNEDPTVFWFNTQLMEGYWATHAPGIGSGHRARPRFERVGRRSVRGPEEPVRAREADRRRSRRGAGRHRRR